MSIWSATDLIVDRIAQAAEQGGIERLGQALALRPAAGEHFDVARARERAARDGIERELRAFEQLVAVCETRDLSDEEAVEAFRHPRASP